MTLAIAARHPGPPDVLEQVTLPAPMPGPDQAVVRHTAIGVNFIDTYFRSGLYPWPVETGLVPGSEAAGVITALGENVQGFAIGERVAYTIPNGAYATERALEARHLVRIPDGIDDETAAAAMLKGLTAHYLLHRSFVAQKGATVLFHASAGGVGLIAGQWLAARGVTAIGTAGGPEKCALAAAHGYAHVIDYTAGDFVAQVGEITGGAGVDAVYDSVGKDTIAGSLACLKTFGTLVNFGQSSGPYTGFALSDLAVGSYTVTRPVLFHFTNTRAYLETAAADLFKMIGSGAIKININQRFALTGAADAHRALEGRKTTGSTVLIPG
jgi:NADPH2:quinone reductase